MPRVEGNLVEVKVHSRVSLRHSHPKVGAGRREMAGHNVVILRLAREGGREGGYKGNRKNIISLTYLRRN